MGKIMGYLFLLLGVAFLLVIIFFEPFMGRPLNVPKDPVVFLLAIIIGVATSTVFGSGDSSVSAQNTSPDTAQSSILGSFLPKLRIGGGLLGFLLTIVAGSLTYSHPEWGGQLVDLFVTKSKNIKDPLQGNSPNNGSTETPPDSITLAEALEEARLEEAQAEAARQEAIAVQEALAEADRQQAKAEAEMYKGPKSSGY